MTMTPSVRFILDTALNCEETRHVEFKELKSQRPFDSIANTADEYAVAFLNSEGGRIYWGIRDTDKVVVGVTIPESERDRLRRYITNKLSEIQPQLDPSRFKITLHAVVSGNADLVVVELEVPAGNSSTPFYTASHECFVRLDGVKKKLSGQQLTDWILSRAAAPTSFGKTVEMDLHLVSLAKRVRRIFSEHGLQPGHLSRFFAIRKAPFTITLSDQQNDVSFLQWLNEPKIAWIAKTFGVRREWIDGEDGRIFEEQRYDKRPSKFLSDISRYTEALIYEEVPESCDAWFLRFGIDEDWKSKGHSGVFVVIRVPLARMSNEVTIYRYISDFEPYGWDNGRTAIQLRAWARLLFISKDMICYGREVPYELGQEIWGNSAFLHGIIESHNGCRHCRDDWHPEDYALYPTESCEAKPDSFFPHVIEFLRENGLAYEPTKLFRQ